MSDPLRVKLLSPLTARYFLHQLPDAQPAWDVCRFSFDPADDQYDWLVVYEDLPPRTGMQREQAIETLACLSANTLLVTSEPSSIKHYGNAFTRQFGCVLTSQPAWALPHQDRIFSQPALAWMYGVGTHGVRSFNDMLAHPPTDKTRLLSMVFSPKRQRHTLHHRRNAFMQQMMGQLPDMDVYGRGAQLLEDNDKAHALDNYRYHIAVENHVSLHHWTEKLADAFLGLTLPFYYGCPNATDYFPADSFIPIDIRDPEKARRIISEAIANDEYTRRLPAITEARRRVLHDYNLFAVLAREISRRHPQARAQTTGTSIYSRHALRKKSLATGLKDVYGKVRARLVHLVRRD